MPNLNQRHIALLVVLALTFLQAQVSVNIVNSCMYRLLSSSMHTGLCSTRYQTSQNRLKMLIRTYTQRKLISILEHKPLTSTVNMQSTIQI